MAVKKSDISLFVLIIISYICYFISTIARADFWIDVFSPINVILTSTLVITCLSRMGKFWVPCLFMAVGIMFYAAADVLSFIGSYVLVTSAFDEIITFVYLLPNFCFGIAVAIYFTQKLKGRELYQFLINSFTLTVVGFVIFRRALIFYGSYSLLDKADLFRVYLYFFINLFILIMVGHMVFMIAFETGLKATNFMLLGVTIYILMDIPYTLLQVVGKDPENIYTDLIYTFCMMLMAYGVLHQVHFQHVFKLRPYEYTEASAKRTRIIALLGLLLSFAVWGMKLIDQNDLFCLVIAMLAFWITSETFLNSALNEQILKQQDLLTGLYNRRYSNTVLTDAIKDAVERKKKFAVFCVDLNNFKPVNDTYGHDMGDRVLKEYGNRMLNLPPEFTSFRTGGDEFMIVRTGIEGERDLVETTQLLRKLFDTPMNLDTYIFSLSGSIGVSVYPDDSTDPGTLVRYADAAMYAVKHSQNKDDYKIFDITLVESVEKQKALEEMVRNCDPARDFVLYYQPRFNADTGQLVAVEAFPRLKDENEYMASELIPIVEEVGAMNRLGRWIITKALSDLHHWNQVYHKNLSVSINVSPLQLLDKDFIVNLKRLTEENSLLPGQIILDISNEVMMGASIAAKETLRSLDEYGFSLSLNDFGGNDINLSQVLTCGFSEIHISPSLIAKADSEATANVLIKAIIGIADNMGIAANAIGIETGEQADKMRNLGVKTLQGYYYGKPVDAAGFTELYMGR
jgi:diguanylate cyclase (GGDEF)-like protein